MQVFLGHIQNGIITRAVQTNYPVYSGPDVSVRMEVTVSVAIQASIDRMQDEKLVIGKKQVNIKYFRWQFGCF